MTGTYVGPEEQFKGRTALIRDVSESIIQAQFNEGKVWEMHSWLTFERRDWHIEQERNIDG